MNSMVPAARLEHVRFSYDNGVTWVLDGIDLTIRSGERLCLVGPNGSGKSTLARLIAGLAAPDGGDMTLLGHHVFDGETASANPSEYRDARHGIGTVFQNPEDQIVTTIVEDDVAFGPENLGVARDDIGGRIDESLQSVDMAGSATRIRRHERRPAAAYRHRRNAGDEPAHAGASTNRPRCWIPTRGSR